MNAYSPQELNDAMALARQNVEQFRFEAAKAHGAYTKQQRKWDRQLGSGSAAAGEFYAAYREKLRPSLVQIEKKQARASLATQLERSLSLTPQQARHLDEELRHRRQRELADELSRSLSGRSARRRATALARLPRETIDLLAAAYKQHHLYSLAARKMNIAVVDAHGPFLKKIRAKARIRRERAATLKKETTRLAEIERTLATIDAQENGLPKKLTAYRLELMPILGLRHDFEKSRTRRTKPATGADLEHFEQTTAEFIATSLEPALTARPALSFQEAGQKKLELQSLLLAIFSLDASARNRLVLSVAEYGRLYDEQQRIIAHREAREAFLAAS